MISNFYKAFEDKFRGSRDLIKSRLRVYLPFISPLKEMTSNRNALDLGCGRGEWLEILAENDFKAKGVDLDAGMLEECRKHNFDVSLTDALGYLKEVPDESLVIVSAFHLIEHIPFQDLLILVEEVKRVLCPGGLLIMETPNPENIVNGTSNFYLDPTHTQPIPPQLLAFLPDFLGYHQVKTLRLQEYLDKPIVKELDILDVLEGVSPDFSVIAQKSADQESLKLTSPAFQKDYGFTLKEIAMAYTEQNSNINRWLQDEYKKTKTILEERTVELTSLRINEQHLMRAIEQKEEALNEKQAFIEKKETEIHDANRLINEKIKYLNEANALVEDQKKKLDAAFDLVQQTKNSLNSNLQTLETKNAELGHAHVIIGDLTAQISSFQVALTKKTEEIEYLTAQVNGLNHSSHHWYMEFNRISAELNDVYKSKSWKITYPLRLLVYLIKTTLKFILKVLLAPFKWFITKTIVFVKNRPFLKNPIKKFFKKLPVLDNKLRRFAINRGLIDPLPPSLENSDLSQVIIEEIPVTDNPILKNNTVLRAHIPNMNSEIADITQKLKNEIMKKDKN